MNFYNKQGEQNFEWQKLFKKVKPIKAKKREAVKSNFRSKKVSSMAEEKVRNASHARTINVEPLSQTTTKFGAKKTPRKKRKSSVGFNNLAMKLIHNDSEEGNIALIIV